MAGFKRKGGQNLILLYMHAGVKRNLSETQCQSLPGNSSDGKCTVCAMNVCSARCHPRVTATFSEHAYFCLKSTSVDTDPSVRGMGIYLIVLYRMNWRELRVRRERMVGFVLQWVLDPESEPRHILWYFPLCGRKIKAHQKHQWAV